MISEKDQQELCDKYCTTYYATPSHLKVGIAENVKQGLMPLNGLRIQPEGDTSGWYIWAGEVLSDEKDFFLPLHIEHIAEWSPLLIKYLGLPPGSRFLVTPDYEDVWHDNSLLEENELV